MNLWIGAQIDNLYYRLIFDRVKKHIPGKNLLKVVKFQNLVKKCCNVWKCNLQILYIIVFSTARAEIVTAFGLKMVNYCHT